MLYFVHGLIRYGEPLQDCIQRLVAAQAGVNVEKLRVVDLDSVVHEEQDNWGIIPHVIATVNEKPETGEHGNAVTEVVAFTPDVVPDGFAWWPQEELATFLTEHG